MPEPVAVASTTADVAVMLETVGVVTASEDELLPPPSSGSSLSPPQAVISSPNPKTRNNFDKGFFML
jgi:hypothetical protein